MNFLTRWFVRRRCNRDAIVSDRAPSVDRTKDRKVDSLLAYFGMHPDKALEWGELTQAATFAGCSVGYASRVARANGFVVRGNVSEGTHV